MEKETNMSLKTPDREISEEGSRMALNKVKTRFARTTYLESKKGKAKSKEQETSEINIISLKAKTVFKNLKFTSKEYRSAERYITKGDREPLAKELIKDKEPTKNNITE